MIWIWFGWSFWWDRFRFDWLMDGSLRTDCDQWLASSIWRVERSTHTWPDPGHPAGPTGLIIALSPALQARSSDLRTVALEIATGPQLLDQVALRVCVRPSSPWIDLFIGFCVFRFLMTLFDQSSKKWDSIELSFGSPCQMMFHLLMKSSLPSYQLWPAMTRWSTRLCCGWTWSTCWQTWCPAQLSGCRRR